jgi:hypothetical protein
VTVFRYHHPKESECLEIGWACEAESVVSLYLSVILTIGMAQCELLTAFLNKP